MATKWQRFEIPVPDDLDLNSTELELLGQTYIDYILKRTKDGLGRGRNDFPSYSKEYIQSLNFKIAGKSKNDVNLTLSGDMLGSLEVLDVTPDKVTVGFEDGTNENAIADGNIRGTYGKAKADRSMARDFLTATNQELETYVFSQLRSDPAQRKADAEALALAQLASKAGVDVGSEDEGNDGE